MNGWRAAACVLIGGAMAMAFASGAVAQPNAAQPAATFQGVIPTEAKPITGEKRLARMREAGKLPDIFVRGRCTYNLAGDIGAAYYVKECR
jgi:hypothetical protein